MATIQFGNFLSGLANEVGNIQGVGASIATLTDGIPALQVNDPGVNQGTLKVQGLVGTFGKLGTPIPNIQNNYFRFYFQPQQFPAANSEQFYNIIDVTDNLKFSLRFDSNGRILVFNIVGSPAGTLIASMSTVLSIGTWYRLECFFGTGTSAPYEVHLAVGDGAFVESISGTGNFGTSGGFEPGLGKDVSQFNQPMACNFRDLLWSDSGFPGPGHCAILVPTADGFYQNGTANGAAARWRCLNQIPPDDDTTFLNGLTGQAYTAIMSPLPNGTIHAVKSYARFRSDDGVTAINCQARLRSGGKDFDTTDNGTVAQAAYINRMRIFDTDPATGSQWTLAGVNALEAGFKDGTGPGRLTSVFAMVDYLPVMPAELVSGLYLFALKGFQPFRAFMDFQSAKAAYLTGLTLWGQDTAIDTAGLSAPFTLGYFRNTGSSVLTVKDGVAGPTLLQLAPNQESFLFGGLSSPLGLGKNTPALAGVSQVEYCCWK